MESDEASEKQLPKVSRGALRDPRQRAAVAATSPQRTYSYGPSHNKAVQGLNGLVALESRIWVPGLAFLRQP